MSHEQGGFDFADLAPPAIHFSRVVNNPIRMLRLKVRTPDKKHRVIGLGLPWLAVKENVARPRRPDVARDNECVVVKERRCVRELGEGAVGEIPGRKWAGPCAK